MKRFIHSYIIPPIAYITLYLVSATLRLEQVDNDFQQELVGNNITAIGLFWHGRLFYVPYHYRRWLGKVAILVSPSVDGEIISRTLNWFGFKTVRGSSYKSSRSALRKLQRNINDGVWPVLIADGSRGPAFKLQPGALMLSKLTGSPILPLTVSFSKYWTVNSWDKLMIPKPFASVVVVYGQPVTVPSSGDSQQLELKRLELERILLDITEKADKYFAAKP